MATSTTSRSRHAAQIRTLAAVEPEVRACDQTWRRKYLQDYAQAFRSYKSILSSSELETSISAASIILIGDYHALPSCQRFVADLVKQCAQNKDSPVVLAVETIFSRDQHILDEWWREEICEQELRQRVRFDLDWGYDWDPFYELLLAALKHAEAVFGLDCMPREDLRKIGARDRHAAHKLAEIRERHPQATIVALIGESHLAPTHLPAHVAKQLPGETVLSVLQNVDALYWDSLQEKEEARTVRVNGDTICVFNSTPLEKYESYRICLDRWRSAKQEDLDFAPAIYDLIDQLARFLDINRYSSRNGTQPKFLMDLLPEVYGPSTTQFRKLLSRRGVTEEETRMIFHRLDERGCLYLPRFNAFIAQEFRMISAAEEAARFVHHACQGLHLCSKNATLSHDDRLQAETVEHALAYLGSRVLCRNGPQPDSDGPESIDITPIHTERSSEHRAGYSLGDGLHRAYLRDELSRTDLKRLFLFSIREPGKAGELCSQLSKRLRLAR
jgi:uncharacterized iron-regulated protein